jgi:VanZ family protein
MRATIHGLRIAIVALLFYWLLLFIGTHIPANRIAVQIHENDKLIHALAFAGLSFLMAWAIPTNKQRLHRNTMLAAVATVVYAAFDELLQIPVGRTADWRDFLADCVGVCMGLTFYTIARAIILKANWNLLQDPK